LAIGGIAAKWEFRPPNLPFSWGGPGPLSNTMLFGTTAVSLPNGTSFCLMALAGFKSVTDRQTDRPRADIYVTIGGIAYAFIDAA